MAERREEEPRPPGPTTEKKDPPNSSTEGPQKFDLMNWFYWSVWWQQYSYWLWHLQTQGPAAGGNTDTSTQSQSNQNQGGQDGGHTSPYQQQWTQYYNQMNPPMPQYYPQPQMAPGFPPANQGHYGIGDNNIGMERGGHQQGGGGGGHPWFLRIRVMLGFEVFMAAVWKRIMAEVIDMVLFGFVLKAYMPEIDYRIPEVVFESGNTWADLDDEELLEIKDTLTLFIFSVLMERMLHALMETIWIAAFACTPGKWLMGLRVYRCVAVHYTRTSLGKSVRIEPGGKLPLIYALVRALFKSSVSLFCPLIIFFMALKKGRPKYDELLQSTVVDIRSLYRPVYAGRGHPRPQVQVG